MHTYYRFMVWLPLLLPLLTVLAGYVPAVREGPLREPAGILIGSLIYGGLPYLLLALWATFWIDHRPESDIRRLALMAPLLMLAAYAVQAGAFGLFTGEWRVARGLLLFGLGFILALGYTYVVFTLLVARLLRARWQPHTAREAI